MFFSVDAHFGTAAGDDIEIPALEDILDEEEEKKLADEDEEVSSTLTKFKVPRKEVNFATFIILLSFFLILNMCDIGLVHKFCCIINQF